MPRSPVTCLVGLGVAVTLLVGLVIVGVRTIPDWWRSLPPDMVSDLDTVCSGRSYGRATPYAGPGPHPIAIFQEGSDGQLLPRYLEHLRADGASWLPADARPDDVQLVACLTLADDREIAECSYGGLAVAKALPMNSATYEVRVYELRTHREVLKSRVVGQDVECPPVLGSNDLSKSRLLSDLTPAQWKPLLGDLVTKSR